MGEMNTLARRRGPAHRSCNVGEGERYGSILGGAALVILGLNRRGWAGLAAGGVGLALIQRGVTGHCAFYEGLGLSSARSQRAGVPDNVGTRVERSITVRRSPEDVYHFWRRLETLAAFMKHVKRVEVIDDTRSRWFVTGPAGKTLEWEAQIINEHPGELIAWESLPGAAVENAGTVRFEPAPGNRGTEVKVTIQYQPPGGVLGVLGAKLFGASPEKQLDEDLARLKQILEAGEVATTGGQPSGRSGANGGML